MRRFLMIAVLGLLVSACSSATPTATTPPVTETPATPVETEVAASPAVEIDVRGYPISPLISARTLEIFRDGRQRGRNPHVFSKIGDCMTASPHFLIPFGTDAYDLGDYADLQETIDWFRTVTVREVDGQAVDSFANPSIAATDGFTSASPLDSTWADPKWCQPGESSLKCEYRVSNPSLALIMFGTSDVYSIEIDKYERYLRSIVEETIGEGIVPVLSTFPPRPDYPAESEAYNRIVARIAADYDIPLVNLWLALQDKPGYGVDPEHPNKLTLPEDGCAACFTAGHLDAGITVHNMVILTALDEIRQALGG